MDKNAVKKALDLLNSIKDERRSAKEQMERERRELITSTAKNISEALRPTLDALARQSQLTRRDLLDAIAEIKVDVNVPDVVVPKVDVPQPKVSVFTPEVKVPDIKMPDEMNIKGWVSLMGVDLNNPLPVQLRDASGNPVALFENLNQFISSGGGGFRRVKIDNPSTEPVNVTIVSGASATSAVNIVDSSGVAYSTSNPVPIDDAGGSITVDGTVTASNTAGNVAHDSADSGNPVKIGGVARTTNPTAVASGDRVNAYFDVVGRQLVRPVQVRGLLLTAYVTEDEIQEVALLAGVSGEYHDLIYVMCANESTAAINLDFRQTTGGTVQMSVEVPASGTAGISLPIPIPQDHADATWTVKNSASDNSNTVYSVTALFSKEV